MVSMSMHSDMRSSKAMTEEEVKGQASKILKRISFVYKCFMVLKSQQKQAKAAGHGSEDNFI